MAGERRGEKFEGMGDDTNAAAAGESAGPTEEDQFALVWSDQRENILRAFLFVACLCTTPRVRRQRGADRHRRTVAHQRDGGDGSGGIGAQAGEVTRMAVCCWQVRDDGSVYVLVHLTKNGKNSELSGVVLVRGLGGFKGNYSASGWQGIKPAGPKD